LHRVRFFWRVTLREDDTVKIRLLYFAALRDLAGKGEETMDLSPAPGTIGALRTHLEHTMPALAGRLGAVRWAKNEVFVGMDATLVDGDVVALIPPVAGG
jgi:molybdopterin converting factor subunit 1